MYNCESDTSPEKTTKTPVQVTLLDLAKKKKDVEKKESVENMETATGDNKESNEEFNESDQNVTIIEDSDEHEETDKKNENVSTPTRKRSVNSPRTPKSASTSKKQEEKQKAKEERERKRQEQKEEKERMKQEKLTAKQREKQEKEEQKRKEKEEKEELKRKEKEEKEELKRKEKEEKEEQKRKEREEKEEQKRKEREEKEEQKRKEKEQKELKKQQELGEKRKKEIMKEKEVAAFANFFVSRKSINSSEQKNSELRFMPFEVKSDMRLAPPTRITLPDEKKQELCDKIGKQDTVTLYLDEVKDGKEIGRSCSTWPVEEEEVMLLEDTAVGECVEGQTKATKMRAKFLHFHENRRPAYFGTWGKKTKFIKPRKPYGQDKDLLNYEVDSDDDWEEEEPGESLAGSDDEDKDNETDDYEVDNDFFVPHGYLSDEEVGNEENEQLTPETHKEKLKLLQIEFEEEMKSKTERIKPRLIGCIWEDKLKPKIQDAITKFLGERMMIMAEPVVVKKREILAEKSITKNNSPSRKMLTKEFIPDFLQFIHGNVNNQNNIINEFMSYLNSKEQDITVTKSALCSQLKQFAKWKKCPDEGAMYNKHCWYVNEDVRDQYNLNLTVPNKRVLITDSDNSEGAKKKLDL